MKVLVVEDEPAIADFIERGLRAEGYVVVVATDGAEGERRALDDDFDLVMLDVMLPGRSGLDVLAAIRRERAALPVIMLTARGEIEEKVAGLDTGATDYVTKPFSFEELTARIRAHLRAPRTAEPTTIGAGGIDVDLLARRVTRNGDTVPLSPTEFDLLAYFVRHPGEVLSRERILRSVWGYDFEPRTNIVQVYVGYLRRKLGRPGDPAPIETVRAVGYRLRADA
jgi:two-component system, OmpR family, response regulator